MKHSKSELGNSREIEVKLSAYQVIDKVVKKGNNSSGRIYVPKSWEGKRVKICLLDKPNDMVGES